MVLDRAAINYHLPRKVRANMDDNWPRNRAHCTPFVGDFPEMQEAGGNCRMTFPQRTGNKDVGSGNFGNRLCGIRRTVGRKWIFDGWPIEFFAENRLSFERNLCYESIGKFCGFSEYIFRWWFCVYLLKIFFIWKFFFCVSKLYKPMKFNSFQLNVSQHFSQKSTFPWHYFQV